MTEWEQIKKEYREIPIPADGSHQLLQTIADAKKNRNRKTHLTKYATVAAALFIMVLLPGMLLFSGGFGAKKENNAMSADCVAESKVNDGGFFKGAKTEADMAPASSGTVNTNAQTSEYSMNTTAKNEACVEEGILEDSADFDTAMVIPWDAVSKEVLRQMEERMEKNGETYYVEDDNYPEGFEKVTIEQEYYFNEEGLLVIVFKAGVVAPKEQGQIEFVIPAEAVLP